MTLLMKQSKATLLVRFEQTRKWGEMRLHGSCEKKRWTCLFSSFCSQSVAEKSVLLNRVSNPRLRKQWSYEGKRMPSDICDQEK